MLIEIALENIILDTDKAIQNYLNKKGYDSFAIENITSCDMRNAGIGCPKIEIVKSMRQDDIITHADYVTGVEELLKFFIQNGVNIKIVSKYNGISPEVRRESIKELLMNIVGNFNTEQITYSFDGVNYNEDASVAIDTDLASLEKSIADTKFLLKKPYNGENNSLYQSLFEEVTVVESLEEIRGICLDLYSEVFNNEKSV